MGGVYGDFIEVFPEMMETLTVWTKDDRSDSHPIRAMYVPTKGGGIKRRKYTSGNTGLDIQDSDALYVSMRYTVNIGDYFQRKNDPYTMRIVNDIPYDLSAGYRVFAVERVTGATPDMDEPLGVKEGSFA